MEATQKGRIRITIVNNITLFYLWNKLEMDCNKGSNRISTLVQVMASLQTGAEEAITWSNNDPVYWRIYATLEEMT